MRYAPAFLPKRMAKAYKIAVLPGEGIGPEVMTEALKVLATISVKSGIQFELTHQLVGDAAVEIGLHPGGRAPNKRPVGGPASGGFVPSEI